jgi:hypothetical protein
MKEGSLVCFVGMMEIHRTNWNATDHVLGVFAKLSMRRGAWAWFHDVWTCGAKVIDYLLSAFFT